MKGLKNPTCKVYMPNTLNLMLCLLLIITACFVVNDVQEVRADGPSSDTIRSLQKALGENVRIGTDTRTGLVTFIGTEPSRPILDKTLSSAIGPVHVDTVARAFLSRYGQYFGLADQTNLSVKKQITTDQGRVFIRFQQNHNGIPVIGAELNIQVDPQQRGIISANGDVIPNITIDPQPTITAHEA